MLESLKRLTYPRDRLVLYFDTNNNLDDTTTILVEWIREHRCLYKDIILHQHDADLTTYAVDDAVLAHRRENALNHCRRNAIRWILTWDADVILNAPEIIQELRRWRKPWIAPLVTKTTNPMWSNFWGAFGPHRFYARSPDYQDLVTRQRKGIFAVALVREVHLIDLHRWPGASWFAIDQTDLESYQILTLHAHRDGIRPHVLNTKLFGHIADTPPERLQTHTGLYRYWSKHDEWCREYLHMSVYALLKQPTLLSMLLEEIAPLTFIFKAPVMQPAFCDQLVQQCEQLDEWSRGVPQDDRLPTGYENVPTVDVHLSQLGLAKIWEDCVTQLLSHYAAHAFADYPTRGVAMAFVVKYTTEDQTHLRYHHDSSVYSINIALNDDFDGGGVYFPQTKQRIQVPKGWMIMHPGRLTHRHAALPVTRGRRYTLVTFAE